MATITPIRQPFGMVDHSRLRNLASTKNRQAALASSSAPSLKPSLKRRNTSPENSDSENVDPELIKSAVKRKCIDKTTGDILKPTTRLSFSLVTKPRIPVACSTPAESVKANVKLTTTAVPASAPTPVDRTLSKHKRAGNFSTRRTSGGSLQYTRLDTPSHGKTRPPLSLTAALSGTFSKSKRRNVSAIGESMPKSWMFDIHEDTGSEDNHKMENLGQSFLTQDISDDEDSSTFDQREKENIPPTDSVILSSERHVAIPASRKNMMTDEPRTPLGNLNAADFYGEGCDATSFVLVAADDAPPEKSSACRLATTPQCDSAEADGDFLDKASLATLIAESAPPKQVEEDQPTEEIDDGFGAGNDGPVEIWESGSAKDEAEAAGERNGESIFAV